MEARHRHSTEYYLSLERNNILLSGTILYHFRIFYQEKVFAHLEAGAKKHAQNIDGFLAEKVVDISVMAGGWY